MLSSVYTWPGTALVSRPAAPSVSDRSCFHFVWLKLPAGGPWSVGIDCSLKRIIRLVGDSFSKERDRGVNIKPPCSLNWKWQSDTPAAPAGLLLGRLLLSENLEAGLNCFFGPSKSRVGFQLLNILNILANSITFLCVYLCIYLLKILQKQKQFSQKAVGKSISTK